MVVRLRALAAEVTRVTLEVGSQGSFCCFVSTPNFWQWASAHVLRSQVNSVVKQQFLMSKVFGTSWLGTSIGCVLVWRIRFVLCASSVLSDRYSDSNQTLFFSPSFHNPHTLAFPMSGSTLDTGPFNSNCHHCRRFWGPYPKDRNTSWGRDGYIEVYGQFYGGSVGSVICSELLFFLLLSPPLLSLLLHRTSPYKSSPLEERSNFVALQAHLHLK